MYNKVNKITKSYMTIDSMIEKYNLKKDTKNPDRGFQSLLDNEIGKLNKENDNKKEG